MAAICSAQQHIDDYIDNAVFKAARYLEDRLLPNVRVAIANDISSELEETVFGILERNLVDGNKICVVERDKKNLQLIEDELRFQYSGEVSDDTLTRLGRKLGAQYIVLVSAGKPQGGSEYSFRVKAVSVETAQIIASNEYKFQRLVQIQSRVIADYKLKQITYDKISSDIQTGDVYLRLGFRIHSEVNIENIPQDIIDSAPSSHSKRNNICFVIDISGSMVERIDNHETNKINWVKRELKSFFEKNIDENDFISVVTFNDESHEIIKSRHIQNKDDIAWCISEIEKIIPGGDTVIAQGLKKGYEWVKVNKRDDYNNCVILFTDGQSNDQEEVKKIVAENKNEDIATISTVALSTSARDFMAEVAALGGGLSLFVDSNNASRSMEKEMSLLANAAAADLKNKEYRLDITLTAHEGVVFKDASEEHSRLNNELAYYSIVDIKEDEYKTIWIKASLGQSAVQTGSSILDIKVISNTLLTSSHQVFLKPPYVTTYNKTKILIVYDELL
jgi:Mg-chelatase subunit ChlD